MKRYHCMDKPIEINGLAPGYGVGRFWKMPENMLGRVNETVTELSRRSTGGRVRFRTDSEHVRVRVTLKTLGMDQNFPILGSAGCDILTGVGANACYAGIVTPTRLDSMVNETTIVKRAGMEDVTIYLPRNERVQDIEIFIDDQAGMESPTPYRWDKPIVYYGSSITEGCTASRPSNAYTALVSKWLHADFLNLGFSGAARGEPAMAEYIAGLDMQALVLDYDHNAPTPEHLEQTHEPFFRQIRAAQPDLPILMMSAPDFDFLPDADRRRAAVRRTYENALAAGDRHVAFIDGATLLAGRDRMACTIDRLHPNEIGMFRMAEKVYPVLAALLGVGE